MLHQVTLTLLTLLDNCKFPKLNTNPEFSLYTVIGHECTSFVCYTKIKLNIYWWQIGPTLFNHMQLSQVWILSCIDIKPEFGLLRVRAVFHKTVRVCHVYSNFKIGFTCWITIVFGTLKDGSLLINTLASNICFNYRNMFQNGVVVLSKIVDAFLSKSSKFYLVWIIR